MIGAKTGDTRIRSLLEELNLAFDMTSAGNFLVTIRFEDDRKQEVYVISDTIQVDRLEVREVLSIGFVAESPPHGDIAIALLVYNSEVTLGAWRLARHKEDDGCTAIFSLPIAADTTAKALYTAITETARAADLAEERFTSKDEF